MYKPQLKSKPANTKAKQTAATNTTGGIELAVLTADDRRKYRVSSYTYLLP